jgi:hypothetical protein
MLDAGELFCGDLHRRSVARYASLAPVVLTRPRLMEEPYAVLAARPAVERIQLPEELSRFEGYIRRKPGDSGGTEITVQIANRVLWLFMEGRSNGFEVLPDGKIIPFDTSVDADD